MREKLQDWFMANKPAEDLIYKDGLNSQVMFIRDKITGLVSTGMSYDERKNNVAFVISTHRSKSVTLPVYSLERPGLQIVLRNNYYNWKMSVISENTICDPDGVFPHLFYTTPPVEPEYTGNPLAPCYFEGFPEELIFDYYEPSFQRSESKWSAEISGDYRLWTAIFHIVKRLDFLKPAKWTTK